MRIIPKPQPGEYDPYAIMYIKLLPDDGLILKHLEENGITARQFFLSIPPKQLEYRYAPDKWTIKEILLHMTDDERIYVYRALRFARADTTLLNGFDQELYALQSKANERTIEDLVEEFFTVRKATLSFFAHIPEEALIRGGIANNHYITVRALLYHLAGHELHHINVIKEKYLI
ncbi:MAG: DinB family protein [Ignavibacteriales bacterium]|nr:DinB family protein [Ignavibacteriales bacterium]